MRKIVGLIPLFAIKLGLCNSSTSSKLIARRVKETDKIIHIVRHAEGFHNVAARESVFLYLREDLEDAMITKDGENQCQRLQEQTKDRLKNVQLIVISPLNRTIQTALHSFPFLAPSSSSSSNSDNSKVSWIVHEMIREKTGLHPCDRRTTISAKKKLFPAYINFDDPVCIQSDKDELFPKYKLREPDVDLAQRGHAFLAWLKTRPEKEIIIVSHGAFLRTFLRDVLDVKDTETRVDLKNCEIRTYVLSF